MDLLTLAIACAIAGLFIGCVAAFVEGWVETTPPDVHQRKQR